MNRKIRLLLIENNPYDAELIISMVSRTMPDVEFTALTTLPEIMKYLAGSSPDIILSDHDLGTFTGMDVFAHVKNTHPDIPFILVTGAMGEEAAVDRIKAGVTDFVLKDRMARLVPAIERALRESEEKIKLKSSESEKNRILDELEHMQRLELLGSYTAEIVHDFKNFITAIINSAELIKLKSADDDSKKYAGYITGTSEKAMELVNKLLVFSRKGEWNPEPIAINEVIRDTEQLIRSLCGSPIEVITKLDQDCGMVFADKSNIVQMLINLSVNARDAISGPGKILISTVSVPPENLDSENMHITNELIPVDYIRITVSDTGCGMKKEIAARIFEPFFTTKQAGKGTGLGLSMVYGIVKRHNGLLEVKSSPGRGTEFIICMPVMEKSRHNPEI